MNPLTQNGSVEALSEYKHLKLELAGIVRSILHIAEKRQDEMGVHECRRLLARIAEDRFNLVVLGQFSRGKSSLMNAILGQAKLPTGVRPLTSVVTAVSYGESEQVVIQRSGWSLPQKIALAALAQYVTQNANPGNEKGVISVDVQLPIELLRLGFHFIDTPGVGSAITANTQATKAFLPEADAAIFVTSFESPLTETELQFLGEVGRYVRTIFVVINKLDLASSEDRGEVVKFVRQAAQRALNGVEHRVYSVSARDALRAKLAGSQERLSLSGLPDLETALTDFLLKEKAREFLIRGTERAASLVRRQNLETEISKRAGSRDGESLKQDAAHRLEELTGEWNASLQNLRSRLRFTFSRYCEEKVGIWSPDAEEALTSELRAWFSREDSTLDAVAFAKFLQPLSARLFDAWLTRHREEVDSGFRGLVQKDQARIEGIAVRVATIPIELLGTDQGTGSESAESICDDIELVFGEIQLPVSGMELPWWYDLLSISQMRDWAVHRCLKKVPSFVQTYEAAVLSVLETAVDEWVAHIQRRLFERIEGMRVHLAGLLERKPKFTDSVESEQLEQRIRDLRRAVLGTEVAEGERWAIGDLHDVAGAPLPVLASPCAICVRVEHAVFDFMRRSQLELSVSKSDQQRHALHGGFCPLHTWQYEAVASPQGICAAYPPLLSLLAKRLRLLAQDAASVQQIRDSLQAALPGNASCPACRLMESIENTAARDLACQLRDKTGATASICVLHLPSILTAGLELKQATRMLLEEARILERLSEDMQSYALMHDAVRRDLSTSGERQASTLAVSRLVGFRNISVPWKSE